MSFENNLLDHLKQFSTNPYLFVGSGISRRYYNLPTWESLLESFFSISKLEGEFNYHLSKNNNNLLQLASEFADAFHEVWWKDPAFKSSRTEHSKIAKLSKQFPFKYEIAQLLKKLSKIDPSQKNEIELLSKSVVEGIITTNWDDLLQDIFLEYETYVGQQQLLFAKSISVGEIYKIHGCNNSPESLVVTTEDYDSFNQRNAYLAAKLLTIFVEHPVIFLGYSISDPNILSIITSIVKCVDQENIYKLKDRLIFVEWSETITEPIFKDGTLMLKDGTVLPIKLIQLDKYDPLYTILGQLPRKLPVKILRRLKDTVYQFIKTTNPTNKIYIGDLNNITDDSKIEFVVGVGAAQHAEQQAMSVMGYKGVKLNDIIEDIITNEKVYDHDMLLKEVVPDIAKGNSFVPLCKYFRKANYIDGRGKLNSSGQAYVKEKKINFRNNMPVCFQPSDDYNKRKAKAANNKYSTFQALIRGEDIEHALLYIPSFERSKINLEQLRKFLEKTYSEGIYHNKTAFRKAVGLYDYYMYGSPSAMPPASVKSS